MKKSLLSILLSIFGMFYTNSHAQYALMYDFNVNPAVTAQKPADDQNLISDGTYLWGMSSEGGENGIGVVFKIKISDNTYTKVFDFDGTNGGNPYGSFFSDGTYMYGMTWNGGDNDQGLIFKIKISDNSYTKIFDFENTTSGSYPNGSLISDGSYLFGLASTGGVNDNGTAFKIKISDNSFTKILDLDLTTKGAYPYGNLLSDGTFLYGLTSEGGANGLGCMYKIKISDNSYTKISDFDDTNKGSNPWGSVVSDGTFLYGLCQSGGTNGTGTVYKVKISDNSFTKILDFDGATKGSTPKGSFVSDGTYLYGMSSSGGANDLGTAYKIKMSDNSFTKILDFAGTTNGANPRGSFTLIGNFLYGMTNLGGIYNGGAALKIDKTTHALTKIADFSSNLNGSSPYNSVISDANYLYGTTYYGGANNMGSVFRIKKSDNTYTKLLDFNSTNGSNPRSNLLSDGTYLYGSTYFGGVNDFGSLFKLKISDNSYTKLLDLGGSANPIGGFITDGNYLYGMTQTDYNYKGFGGVFKVRLSDNAYFEVTNFDGTGTGSKPRGCLLSDGTYLYGMTALGGANNQGVVFKIKISDNTFTKILDFNGTNNGAEPRGTLITDGTYLYGMTTYGGTNNMGLVFKIKKSDNSFTKILDFDKTNGENPFGSLTTDNVYLYGMTEYGGINGMGCLFKIKISDNSYTKLMDLNGKSNGSYPIYGALIKDGSFLYGTTSQGGSMNFGTVFKYDLTSTNITEFIYTEDCKIWSYDKTIRIESPKTLGNIQIFEMTGKCVYQETNAKLKTEIYLNNTGIYLVKVNNLVKKVVIK